jgi:hypothetical protein
MVIGVHISEYCRNAIHAVDHHVDLAIVEYVAKRRPAAHHDISETSSLHGRNQFELAIPWIVVEKRTHGIALSPLRVLVHFPINMAVDKQQILPSVVAAIEESIAETEKGY